MKFFRVPHRRYAYSRRFPSLDKWSDKAINMHTQLLGEMIWAWNDLHQSLAFLFGYVIQSSNGSMGEAIWAALKNDSAQRDALLAATKIHYGEKSPLGRRMCWVIKEVNWLSQFRNDFVHTAMGGFTFGPTGLVTAPSFHAVRIGRIKRFSKADTFKILRSMRGDLIQLCHYVQDLSQRVDPCGIQIIGKWPDRPQLHSHKLMKGLYPPIHKKKPRQKKLPQQTVA